MHNNLLSHLKINIMSHNINNSYIEAYSWNEFWIAAIVREFHYLLWQLLDIYLIHEKRCGST